MRKIARRLAVLAASATSVLTMFGSPAQAAGNPYTAASACSADFGGTWASATDGHRSITSPFTGAHLGDVYLMYNSATGSNCVTTIKSVSVGSETLIDANLTVQGDGPYGESGYYKYYAAVQAKANNTCVMYYGHVQEIVNGRWTWGNCG
jgi:hypothetical protein